MKLKVYRLNYDGRHYRLVAAPSKKSAAALCGTSVYHFNDYASQTGNAADIALAICLNREPFLRRERDMATSGKKLEMESNRNQTRIIYER